MSGLERPSPGSPTSPQAALAIEDVLDRLAAARAASPGRCVVAIDGDGTLWEPDVGDHFIDWLVTGGHLRPEAIDGLVAFSRRLGLTSGDAPVAALHARWAAGGISDALAAEAGAVALAGLTPSEATALARRALRELPGGLLPLPGWDPVLAWARDAVVEIWVVSAGTSPMATLAASAFGVPAERVIAAAPDLDAGRFASTVRDRIPVGDGKVERLRDATGGLSPLGAFGNDAPDLELLDAATVGIAVRPTPALRAARPALPWWDPGLGRV